MLKINDIAPDFKLPDQDGKEHKLSSYKGKKVVLYFYPKDMTPGCTTEACNFRNDYSEYQKKGIVIFGISCDDEKSHKKFIEKEKLPFTLLSDKDKTVVQKYDSYGEKSFMGRKYMGIFRKTFLIDEKGKIKKIFEKVDVNSHSKEILEEFN
jgi:peroxiredoxin Q/BCP